MSRHQFDHDHEDGLRLEHREETKKPHRFKVLLHNDDYTTMDFVIHVLRRHFHKSEAEAVHVMLQVHHRGVGVAGIYTKEAAETKVAEVTREARENSMPLLVTAEPE